MHKIVKIERLGDVLFCSSLEDFFLAFTVISRADDNDRYICKFWVLVQEFAKLEPGQPGIIKSSVIRSGCTEFATSIAFVLSLTVVGWWPSVLTNAFINSVMLTSSSTIRIFGMTI